LQRKDSLQGFFDIYGDKLYNKFILLKQEERRMLVGEERNKVDQIWDTFWTGGLINPLLVIEQFTYLLFIK